jgi:hypothetical protein
VPKRPERQRCTEHKNTDFLFHGFLFLREKMRSEEETTRGTTRSCINEKGRPKTSTSRHAMHLVWCLNQHRGRGRRSSFFFDEWAGVHSFFEWANVKYLRSSPPLRPVV